MKQQKTKRRGRISAWILGIALCVLMPLSVSCNSSAPNSNENAVSYTVEELIKKVVEGTKTGYSLTDPEHFAVSSEEGYYYSGIKESAALVEDDAVIVSPMMGQEFSVVAVRVKKLSDVETVKREMLEGNNLNRWICRTADQLIVVSNDVYVLCVMGTKEETESAADAFDSAFSSPSTERLLKKN